jgi:hypothetical protein
MSTLRVWSMTRERLRNAYGQFLTIRRVETFDEQN